MAQFGVVLSGLPENGFEVYFAAEVGVSFAAEVNGVANSGSLGKLFG